MLPSGADLKSSQKAGGYSHNTCAQLHPWTFHAMPVVIVTFRVHIWARWLAAFLLQLPSDTVKASQQGGSFMVGMDLISSCPMTVVCNVFLSHMSYYHVLMGVEEEWQPLMLRGL